MSLDAFKKQLKKSDLEAIEPEELIATIRALQPYDLAEILKKLKHADRLSILSQLDIEDAAEAIEYLDPEFQYAILHHMDENISSLLLHQMSSDSIVDMLLAIHPLQAETLLQLLPDNYREKINQLMTYPEETAGALMTVDYISARAHWSSEQTINHVRKVGHAAELVSYIYVTNIRGELVGIVSLKEIILSQPTDHLGTIATKDVISVSAGLEQEKTADVLSRYGFYALPVVDIQNRIIGIITYDDIVDVIKEEATEDFQKLGGSQPLMEPYFHTSIWDLYSKRIVWLYILLLGGTYTTAISSHYTYLTHQWIQLPIFVSLLTGVGGNTGSQVVTTLTRALSLGEVHFRNIFGVIKREITTGLLIGSSISLSILIVYTLVAKEIDKMAYVVSLSALFIVLWSSLVSAVLPITLHRLKFDPAVISGPLISTLVDGTGLFIYFSIAQLILR